MAASVGVRSSCARSGAHWLRSTPQLQLARHTAGAPSPPLQLASAARLAAAATVAGLASAPPLLPPSSARSERSAAMSMATSAESTSSGLPPPWSPPSVCPWSPLTSSSVRS